MASLRMRTVLVLLGLLFPVPQSFVIRKRSVAGYDAAMKDSKSVFSDNWLPADGAALLDPYSRGPYLAGVPERLPLGLMVPSISSASSLSDGHYLNDLKDEEDEDDDEEEERGFDGEYGTSLIPDGDDDGEGEVDGDGTKLLNKSELENLFENDSSDREKKLMPPSVVDRKSELTKDDVEKLLSPSLRRGEVRHKVVTETKILVGASSSNGTGTRPSYEGVRVVEVTEQQPNGETRKQKQTDWLRSPDLKQTDAPDNGPDDTTLDGTWSVVGDDPEGAADHQRVRHKVKRSEFSATGEDDDDLDKEQGTSDADDVELLKSYIRLQTEENRHLEQALNLAITTQVENSAEYLNDELGQMRLAVENENALEAIRDAIRRRKPDTEEGEEEEAEEDEEDIDDKELERIDNDAGDADDDEFSKRLLQAKLKKFLIDSAVDELKAAGAEEGELGAEEEEEEEEEEEDAEEEEQRLSHLYPNAKVLNPFTRNAYDDYGKPKRSEEYDELIRSDDEDVMLRGTNDVDITDLLDTPSSAEAGGYYCAPVQELTDDCLAASREGLALDAEAVSLCNRHQICYLCGSVFGMTSDTCDRGYLGESERLCSGSEQCTREAAGLYLVMAKARRFVSSSVAFGLNNGVCAAECVYDYIVGDADDRR